MPCTSAGQARVLGALCHSVQAYVRGRPANTMPRFQTKYLPELRWVSSGDMVLVGCGHDPSGVQAVTSNLKPRFEVLKAFHLEPVGASGAGQAEEEALHRIHVDGCWPRVPVQGVGAFFRAVKEGLPKYQVAAQALRQTAPRHCCRER